MIVIDRGLDMDIYVKDNKIPSKEEVRKALELRHTKTVQDKISNAEVAVCGLGGLGSNIAILLARCGIGKLHLIDFDTVDLTNINRQQYDIGQIGVKKTEALTENIKKFAPYTEIVTDFVKLDEKNLQDIISEKYICEAFDDAEAKAVISNVVLTKMRDRYLVGASGMAGYGKSNDIKTRRITDHFYLCGDGTSEICENFGLMAPRVAICAAHEANKIIELIIDN